MQAKAQSQIANGASLVFQMISGCPSHVIPVMLHVLIAAWSPWIGPWSAVREKFPVFQNEPPEVQAVGQLKRGNYLHSWRNVSSH